MTLRELLGGVVGFVVILGFVYLAFGLAATTMTSSVLVALLFLKVATEELGFCWSPKVLRARLRPAASISAPNAGQLAADARTARRHAAQFDLPADPWHQLEAFWSVAGDLPLVIEEIEPAGTPDPFIDELQQAMLTPIAEDAAPDEEPFDLDAFVRRTRARLHREMPSPLAGVVTQRTPATDRIADEHERRLEAVVDAEAKRYAERHRLHAPAVFIVNGAGQVVATHPPGDADQVRCTWPLSGELTEDAEVVATLRSHGVKVATEMYGGQLVAHLSGTHGALKAARADYMRGLRERTA